MTEADAQHLGDAYNAAVAEELRAERGRANMDFVALSEASGVPRTSLKRYLDGDRDIPMPAFFQICGALGVDPGVIIERAQHSM